MRTWKVLFRAIGTAYVKVPDNWDDKVGIEGMVRGAISFWPTDGQITLELEEVECTDTIEIEE